MKIENICYKDSRVSPSYLNVLVLNYISLFTFDLSLLPFNWVLTRYHYILISSHLELFVFVSHLQDATFFSF